MRIYLNNHKTVFFFLAICLSQYNEIVIANPEAEYLYQSGITLFNNAKYEDSIEKLEIAIKLEPEIASYHHILAKSYGREAEKSGWFKAIKFAKKTRLHLELAAELDPENIEILSDLMKFYNEAPMFLGGSSKKANKINNKIKKIHSNKY